MDGISGPVGSGGNAVALTSKYFTKKEKMVDKPFKKKSATKPFRKKC